MTAAELPPPHASRACRLTLKSLLARGSWTGAAPPADSPLRRLAAAGLVVETSTFGLCTYTVAEARRAEAERIARDAR